MSRIFGCGGDVRIDAKNGKGDEIDCGPSLDTVTYDKVKDDVNNNCEVKRT